MSAEIVQLLPPAERRARPDSKFAAERINGIGFESREEFLVKRLIPQQGIGVLYGASQSLKSFIALDLALHVALGWNWAGRRVTQAPVVYIAAEGAAGLRKRIAGFKAKHANSLPGDYPFHLISSAPNLGTERGDRGALTDSIEDSGITPRLIVIDTLAQSLGAADENGSGMIQFVANATALANHFGALVLIVHHIGLTDGFRPRGHSSLIAGADVQMLCQRQGIEFVMNIQVQKLKDDESNLNLTARLSKFVLYRDEDGDDVSTLVVDAIEVDTSPVEGPAKGGKKPRALSAAATKALSALRMAIGKLLAGSMRVPSALAS
jgi:hypothetical protein